MENDAPVVGPDAPTANSKMVKLDIATADWSRPTSGLGVIQTYKDVSACSRSASPRCLDGGDVDLLHRHHRLEGTLCLTATSRKRID
jgi:hypothetical protein